MKNHSTEVAQRDSTVRIRSYAIYAAMIAAVFAVCYTAITRGWDYGPVTFVTMLGFICLFIILERLIPNNRDWHPTWREWLRDGTYFSLTVFAGALSQALVLSLAIRFSDSEPYMPLAAEIPLALLISTFGGYWFHRLGHGNAFFWQVHGIHHVPPKVNLANNSVVHFIDVAGPAIVTQLPLFILSFSEESMFITSVFTAMQGYFIHSNADIKLGRLSYVLATPEAHRLHHSVDLEEAGNFGSDIALWDVVFRTFTWKENRVPEKVGVVRESEFPPTAAIHKNIVHPFFHFFRKP